MSENSNIKTYMYLILFPFLLSDIAITFPIFLGKIRYSPICALKNHYLVALCNIRDEVTNYRSFLPTYNFCQAQENSNRQ